MKKTYKVEGMSCAACSQRVERAVGAVHGVENCTVNLLRGRMTVEGDVSTDSVINAVRAAGYGAESLDALGGAAEKDVFEDKETPVLIKRLVLSIGFLVFLMYFSMGHMLGIYMPDFLEGSPLLLAAIQLILSGVVLIINRAFFINGAKSLFKGAPNMDTLVSVGSFVSYLYSVCIFVLMCVHPEKSGEMLHGLYFESAAMILALITLGKMLEARAKGRTTDALKSLVSLTPKTARLIVDGVEKEVGADEVKLGDLFAVRPGEAIPTDATVVEGESAVDESMLTGESIPTDKRVGATVYASTINRSGYLVCRATGVGEDTVLSGIIKLVGEASSSKAPIARLADKISGIFVPVVLGISLLTFAGWLLSGAEFSYAIARAISVTVISCPCALGLATPVAIMVGSGVGARRGILFKSAASLEAAGRVRTVVLDKTGTVTKGAPTVTDLLTFGNCDKAALLKYAYSLEYLSEHPLAEAVCKTAESEGVQREAIEGFKALGGRGVSGYLYGSELFGVSFEYAKTLTIVDTEVEKTAERISREGKTPLCFIKDRELIGIIAVADEIKEDAHTAVAALKSMGLKVVMLTGDNSVTARAVADKVGICEVVSGVLPEGKAAEIDRLKKSGFVCMVGDGVNDAPALATAELGVAIGAGTDIAIESADVVLIENKLLSLPAAISLGRATLKNIRENLGWAFIYNLVGIPLAAGLFGLTLNPMFGAAAMSLSSFSVVMNALRLNMWKPKFNVKSKETKSIKTEENKVEKVIRVEGMMCPHCEARVKKALEALEKVSVATPDHKSGTVSVVLEGDVSDDVLKAAIEEQGYNVL